jgi:5-methylcytosine-specific restriction endonuclease McrA
MLFTSKVLTLCLNKSWIPIGTKSVADAISCLYSGDYQALHIQEVNDEPIFEVLTWEDWIRITVSENDLSISSVKMTIKIPTVIICKNYNAIPMLEVKLNHERIIERDNYTCQYSGKKFHPDEVKKKASIDHIIPRSRGGKDSWDNLVLCDKDINSMKANKTPEEAGLKLIRKPSLKPYKVPYQSSIRNINHYSWKHFIIEKNEQ